ncbi:S8 family serine peptidase [Streptomyces sp. NPDC002187]|uniref:S53 family peptidase n=1 Tax=Streptomyces sp. NPDC002187 TaxID=3364637 RepID=UPI0036CD8D19
MRFTRVVGVLLGAVPLVASLAFVPSGAQARTTDPDAQRVPAALAVEGPGGRAVTTKRVCEPSPGRAACTALLRTDLAGVASLPTSRKPAGLSPADIRSAYKLPRSGGKWRFGGKGRTVAIINAFNYPTAEADLAVYRKTFHLPPCTTANGCFRKINQNGGSTPPPTTDPDWALESAIDIQAVSAACSGCNILLVEAQNDMIGALLTAVQQARLQGAKFISMSWTDGENSVQPILDQTYFNHPGIAFVAASGDLGGVVQWPAVSQYVTAAGGTRLNLVRAPAGSPQASRHRWYETAWFGSGSGCSQFQPKPPWQTDPLCPRRTSADVSAVADPATGLAIYTTTTTSTGETGGSWSAAPATSPR